MRSLPTPFFSVLIPSYNRPEFVGEAVESVLASTFADFEVLVSDDRSPRQDEIREVLKQYGGDSRLRLFFQDVNLREPRNRAFLADNARGEWLLTLCDDDVLFHEALASIRRAIAADEGAQLLVFGYEIIDERGFAQYSRRAPRSLQIHRDDPRILRHFLYSRSFPYWYYQPATFAMHKTVRGWVQPDADIGMGDDIKFLFDYVDRGGTIQVIPEVLMRYRKFSEAASHLQGNQSAAPMADFGTRYKILKKLEETTGLSPQVREVVQSAAFRDRFLYQGALAASLDPDDVLEQVHMEPRYQDEFREYTRRHHGLARMAGYLGRSWYFVTLFGWRGVVEIFRVLGLRMRSALRRRRR